MAVKFALTALFCLCYLDADDTFLTRYEYAKMLYKNPRGISCAKCHGPKGEGGVISRYITDGKLHEITAPPIVDLPLARFQNALKRRSGLMPEYFLTEMEMAYLYYYLSDQNRKSEKKRRVQ
ncbi:MAG TPA: cytochrome c [Campylobacteraceae bacterium]|nr:cytochrome c [Campylobacteraceae bacterium]